MRGAVALVCLVGAQVAHAQPKLPPLVGATVVTKFTTPVGFIDDVIAVDDARIAYVVADASSKAELHVVTLAGGADQVVDLAAVTLHPVGLTLAGPRALVIGVGDDATQVSGAMIELVEHGKKPAGTIVYKIAPANHIAVITRDGKPVIAVHRAIAGKAGTRHEVELDALETGRRIGGGHPLELDSNETNTKLDFHVNHWADGMTRAIGIKGGEWDRKENARSPNTEATYDLVTGKFVDVTKITDLFEQRRRFQALAEVGDRIEFLRMAWDNSAVQIWHGGKPRAIELDQPITNYDFKTLQGVIAADGSAWFALKVDKTNPDAVARKKADPEYLDIFHVGTDTKAVRKMRILATDMRHRFGLIGDKLWLVERNNGFERGGKSLTIYQLQ
jgi:hypothetical protein